MASGVYCSSCFPHTGIVHALSILIGVMPPTSSSCVSHHTHQYSASRAWPARTKPGKAGLLPTRLASDVTPINHQPQGRDFARVTLGGGASACSAHLLVPYCSFGYKNIGKIFFFDLPLFVGRGVGLSVCVFVGVFDPVAVGRLMKFGW